MTSILIVYGTGEGQTAKVATGIESILTDRGLDVTTRHVFETTQTDVDEFDAVLIGSSVNNRQHHPEVVTFVKRHQETLAKLPTGFFQLSLASAVSAGWARDGALGFVEQMTEATGWEPDKVGLFAGALKYSQYGRAERIAFRLAAKVMGLDSDTSRDYEYTDWDDVERFAVDFGKFAERDNRKAVRDRDRTSSTFGRSVRRALVVSAVAVGVAAVVYRMTKDGCSNEDESDRTVESRRGLEANDNTYKSSSHSDF
jgi:menaquinone-dependent protoporphyrinogen oxidase